MTAAAGVVRRGGRDLAVPLGSAALALVGLLVWWLSSLVVFVVPSPLATGAALVSSLGESDYWVHIRSTAWASLLAFVLAVLIGTAAGLLLGLFPMVRRVFEPTVIALNGIPKIVLFPVVLLVLGVGTPSKATMGLLIGLFPVMMNVAAGVRTVPEVYRRLARVLCASSWQTFWHVLVPAIRRPLATGVRLAVSLSVVGVVLAEIFAAEFGLGRVFLARYSSGQYAEMMGTVMLLLLVSFGVTFLLWKVEKRVR